MTDRITVSAASGKDAPAMPSWVSDDQVTYAQAGVDTAEGARAVDAIKESVHSTYRPEVVGDIGGFGGLFSIAAAKDMDDPILVSGTDGVGTKLQVAARPASTTRWASTWWPCASTTCSPRAPSPSSSSTTSQSASSRARPWPKSCRHRRRLPPGGLRAHRRGKWPSIPA